MYSKILKKDLKRKKTMNVILLLFIILSVMFVSSSVNNLLAVTNALDDYFYKAGVPDYFLATRGEAPKGQNPDEVLDDCDNAKSYNKDQVIFFEQSSLRFKGEQPKISNISIISSVKHSSLVLFDSNNNKIESVNDGEAYFRKSFLDQNGISIGDKVKITIGDRSKEFTVKDSDKDAVFGSSMMGTMRVVLSENDYDFFASDDNIKNLGGSLYFINSDNPDDLAQVLTDCPNILFSASQSLLKITYIMDMIVAGVLLIVSVCLILISFVMLRFTISFTLSEEYREIGIMKAIGIRNVKIRGIYMTKYIAMSLLSAIVGLILSVPFGDMLLKQASDNIVIVTNNGYLISALCGLLVVGIIMLFCYKCTGKVKKFSPIDAIRGGETGKRYKKKGVMRLSKSKLKPVLFMAANDIVSGIRHYAVMFITFLIGILLITIVANTATTLSSGKLVRTLSMIDADVFVASDTTKYYTSDGKVQLKEDLKSMEKDLKEKGIDATCFAEALFYDTISKGDKSYKSLTYIGVCTTADQYDYIEGTPPQNINEVALASVLADELDAKVGDTVTVATSEGDKKYIVSAIFQTMSNMGHGVRFYQDVERSFEQMNGVNSFQIKYNDNPSASEKEERLKTIKDMYKDDTVSTDREYVNQTLGNVSSYMDGLKTLLIVIVMMINILVVVLMEKSFIIKEKGEIAQLKALGFRSNTIIIWQTLRIAIVIIIAAVAAALLSNPIGQLTTGAIFRMMGAQSITFEISILESYIIYPLIVTLVTVLSAFVVAQQIRKISSSEINTIE